MTFLPNEILQKIFNLLTIKCHNVHCTKSLFNCLLVNRHWCVNAVIILWKDPFSSYNGKKSFNMMVTSFLICLDVEECKDLEKHGVILPNYEPMFDYPKYLSHLNINGLKGAIFDKIIMKNESDRVRNLVMKYILIMLSRRENKLDSLTIRIGYGCLSVSINDIRILLNPNVRSLIEPVKKINLLLGSPTDGFIIKLASICQNLDSLNISFRNCGIQNFIDVAHLVKVQKSLELVQISHEGLFVHLILNELQAHAKSLRFLKFNHVDFYWVQTFEVLAELKNLEVLHFVDCKNIRINAIWPLITSSFNNLGEVLVIDTDCTILENWAKMQQVKVFNRKLAMRKVINTRFSV
ncbi:E3 ubiquitin-protein ligase RAD18 [Gigaspora margarita]|uniref:E3 ubiquitin-protein ligase RAD18 n=1 Tax=Gigaspora margarita TaxID=4874 RepID=A0A8H4A327_GIGMA|nr:E3 ubiquitin-protein ligase RAD18 [Gigaspora margarita]